MHYELHLPFPPTINSYYKQGTGYQKYISLRGRKYRDEVEAEIEEQLVGVADLPFDHKLNVTVVLHMPDKRTRDLDNYMKSLLDALTKAGVWEDDSLIDQLIIYRGARCYGGAVRLAIHDGGPVIPMKYPVEEL